MSICHYWIDYYNLCLLRPIKVREVSFRQDDPDAMTANNLDQAETSPRANQSSELLFTPVHHNHMSAL